MSKPLLTIDEAERQLERAASVITGLERRVQELEEALRAIAENHYQGASHSDAEEKALDALEDGRKR
jgi:hypothetical protein